MLHNNLNGDEDIMKMSIMVGIRMKMDECVHLHPH